MTGGAELCASHTNTSPNASDCAIAYDETYRGRVDLSKNVVVGKPVRKSATRWSVPYDVKDEAGNEAETVWRDILVEEVDLSNVESRIRKEVMQDRQREIDEAVAKALAKEARAAGKCPTCPPCDCSGNADVSSCDDVCSNKNVPQYTTPTFASILSPLVRMANSSRDDVAVIFMGAIVVGLVLISCIALFLCCQFANSYSDNNGRSRQVMVGPDSYATDHFEGDITTPRQQPYPNIFESGSRTNGSRSSMNGRREEVSVDDVFLRSPQRIISPSKTGDGVHMRS